MLVNLPKIMNRCWPKAFNGSGAHVSRMSRKSSACSHSCSPPAEDSPSRIKWRAVLEAATVVVQEDQVRHFVRREPLGRVLTRNLVVQTWGKEPLKHRAAKRLAEPGSEDPDYLDGRAK